MEDGVRPRRSAWLKSYRAPGTPPGTLTPATGPARPSRVVVATFSHEDAQFRELSGPGDLERLQEPREGQSLWIHVMGVGDVALIEELGRSFGLHALALEDVVNLGQRPKIDDFDEPVLFCITQHLAYGADGLEKTQISLFLGDRFVLTFQPDCRDLLAPIRERLGKGRGRLRQKGPAYLAYAIIDLVVDSAFPALEALGDRLDEIEAGILESPDRTDIENLQRTRRELLVLRQVLWPQREVMGRLAREECDSIPSDVRIYFRDCYDHAVQALEVSENFREMASGLLDIYLTSLSHRLNDVMKVLTIISTVFMPLSFLAGVYGMNFDRAHPQNMPELGLRYGYVGFWVICLVSTLSMLWWFKRKAWL